MVDFCLDCGSLHVDGKCPTCGVVDEMSIIERRIVPPERSEQIPTPGRSDLPYGLRKDVRRAGSGKTET